MPDFAPGEVALAPVRVEVALGFVFANLDPDAPSLAETAGDMFADIAATLPWVGEARIVPGERGWDGSLLEANWKVLAENCLECYHCGPAHQAFVDLVDIGSYACVAHGNWLRSAGKILHHRNKAYDVRPDEPVQEAVFWHLWPNVEFGVFPGERVLGAFRFYPESAERTRMSGLSVSAPGERVAPERRNYRWNVLWPEDEAICRSVHRGLKSRGYRQGRFVVHPGHPGLSEHAVHYFQRRYAEVMGLALCDPA
jgi:choline monooxygenase